jgi:predicted transposase/invertase (TIGR01784 family)
MLIDKIRTPDGISILSKLPADYIEKLKENIPPGLYKLLADVITLLLKRINVPDEEIREVTGQLYERRLQEMFTWIENYDVQETRRIARIEGWEEGKAEGWEEGKAEGWEEGREEGIAKGMENERIGIAKRLLEKKIPIEDVADVTGLTIEEINKL